MIVGGWAVHAYNPYLESIDIDVITPHEHVELVESLLTTQCRWIKTTTDLVFWKKFSKQIPDADVGQHIFFDLLSAGLVNAFHENNEKRIPFQICFKEEFYVRKSIDDEININVPKKELLVIYKLKAYRDRLFDLTYSSRAQVPSERDWLKAKMAKDLSDTIALMDPNYGPLDIVFLKEIVNSYQLQFLRQTVEQLPTKTEAIKQYRGSAKSEVQDWIKTILPVFD
ncbi:MAG: hypothetical protein IBV52_03030 [Candidatus Bathyarchaeota archaeon]